MPSTAWAQCSGRRRSRARISAPGLAACRGFSWMVRRKRAFRAASASARLGTMTPAPPAIRTFLPLKSISVRSYFCVKNHNKAFNLKGLRPDIALHQAVGQLASTPMSTPNRPHPMPAVAGTAPVAQLRAPVVVGLVQINNSFSGHNYLPYSVALLQPYVQNLSAYPAPHPFLPPLYHPVPPPLPLASLT